MRLLVATCLLAGAALGCSGDPEVERDVGEVWAPGVVYTTPREPVVRGFLDRRGLIHAHTPHSHDACDGEPELNYGSCLQSFRRGLCWTRHDFAMLTDHNSMFSDTEFPEAVLHDASLGDQTLVRDGEPVANWLACPESHAPLVTAGCESGTMPVGLEGHVADTPAARGAVYGSSEPSAIETAKQQHGVALVPHTEDWSVEQLSTLPLDGFEMYNLHANAFLGMGPAIGLVTKLKKTPEELPYSDLIFLPLFSEDPRYLETWGGVLATGVRRVTTLGTDCHENVFKDLMPDGERIDSFRRMMAWFSNHLLVVPDAAGSFDDRGLKDALREGRLYGVFEALGFAEGFDFHAESGGQIVEMGGEAMLAQGVTLIAAVPRVEKLDPRVGAPEITLRLLRAKADGWDLVHETDSDLSYAVDAVGAYRLEVRMKPRHLVKHLSSYADLGDKDFVWIYSNPVYVR